MNNPANKLLRDVVSRQQDKLRVCGIVLAVLAVAIATKLAKQSYSFLKKGSPKDVHRTTTKNHMEERGEKYAI